jgi:hypothetical protein
VRVLIVVTIVALVLLATVVWWRRRVTTRWVPDAARAVAEPGTPWCTTVWVQKELPRRTMRSGERVTGRLCVDATTRAATFRVPDGQQVHFTNPRAITIGPRGSDYMNTWVEVDCDVDGRRMTVYLNDATWLGWRALLTAANSRLADALTQIREPGADRP